MTFRNEMLRFEMRVQFEVEEMGEKGVGIDIIYEPRKDLVHLISQQKVEQR